MIQAHWDAFWFKTIDARQFAALRIAFGGLSLVYLIKLLPYVATHFSRAGWLGNSHQISSLNGGSWSLFFLALNSYPLVMAYVIFAIGILSSLLLTLGWHSRINAFIAWVVWVSLWNRNPLFLDGDDALIKLMCFYLMLSACGNCWSIDSHLQDQPQYVNAWPLRLIQFQVALLYFVSGWVKFHSAEWMDGTVLHYILVHPHYSSWDGWAFISNDLISGLLAYLADFIRWWELLFPILLFNAYTRKLSLAIGVAFHVGLLLTMNLRWFAIIMLALYLALLPDEIFFRLECRFKKTYNLARRHIG